MADPTDYDNASFIPDGPAFFDRWEERSQAFRAGHAGTRLDIPYGPHPREAFDLYLPGQTARGLMVFIHGGYWRIGHRTLWAYLAAGPLARGWACAMPSYPLCPEVRIAEITRSLARALPAVAAEVPGPLVIAGHSAGGHLALRMVCADMALPADLLARLRGVLAISPLTDLAPLMEMPLNGDLRIDAAEAAAESPVRHAPPALPVEVLVGADERPAFLDQATWQGDAWPDTTVTIAARAHHFDVIDPLSDADSPLLARWLP